MKVLLKDKYDGTFVLVDAFQIYAVTDDTYHTYVEEIEVEYGNQNSKQYFHSWTCKDVGHLTRSDWNNLIKNAIKENYIDLTNCEFESDFDEDEENEDDL